MAIYRSKSRFLCVTPFATKWVCTPERYFGACPFVGYASFYKFKCNRGSKVANHKIVLFNKFVKQVEQIFKNLPKRLEWISFYIHDIPLITELCEEIRKISIENQLNKSKVKALVELINNSDEAFQSIVNKTKSLPEPNNEKIKQDSNNAYNVVLRDMSAREIKFAGDREVRRKTKQERSRQRENKDLNLTAKILTMKRLGIYDVRIARQLNIDLKQISTFPDIVQSLCLSLWPVPFFLFSIRLI